jgi:protoheme IX farnesyltransferase
MYREDYARARLLMLPVVEPDGRSTAAQVVLYTATLLPVGVLPSVVGLSGPIYLTGALISGLVYFALGLQFARQRTTESARHLFFGSITYLPVILALLLVNRV